MAVRMTTGQLAEIETQARTAVPEECCGILVGRRDGDALIVTTIVASPNVWGADDSAAPGPDRNTRFELDPRTHLRVQREARQAGLDIVGFYHSHPLSPPVPSAFDREMAWPGHTYLIISLLAEPPQARCWRVADEQAPFLPEELLIEEPTPPENR